MASVCPNAASAEANYAGPMPIIGLYIAAATAVCFLLILLDVFFAYLDNKPWIPVRFFSLNSFTLTVMGVSTKLSVDLTTYMPGLDAQLSKLCSSVFICICMGFFMPSLGTNKGSDSYSNLTSLTIVVVTIIVNVCMQISSGVIFSFVVEHIVIMVLMLILLWACWSSSLEIDCVLEESARIFQVGFEYSKLVNGKIDRLDFCYKESYVANPQLLMWEHSHCTAIGMLSSLSFTILLQAILRATFLKEFHFCMELSDYKWSIWVVVATQFLTCALGCLSITWRWISMAFHMKPDIKFSLKVRENGFSEWKFDIMYTSDWDIHLMALNELCSGALKCFLFLQSLLLYLRFGTQVLLNFIDELVLFVIHILRISFASTLGGFEYKKELWEWLWSKSKEDLKRWKKKNESNLSELVSELCPSMLPYPSNHQLQQVSNCNKCHLLVVVLLSAKAVLGLNKVDSLLKAFDQVFQVICFVDEHLNSNELRQMFALRVAQDMWMTRDIDSGIFHQKFIEPTFKKFPDISAYEESQSLEFQRTLNLFEQMLQLSSIRKNGEYNEIISEEILQHARELNTIDGLYDVIKQFVLSIMHFYLSSFPTAIYQYIMDSRMDKIEARTKLTVKLYSKLDGLEDKVSWQPLYVRPKGNVISANVVAPSEVLAEVSTRDERGDSVVEPSEVPATTEDTTEI